MYSLAKQLIVEKDLRRKITILENLINHPSVTTSELATHLAVSQRTIFNDLQGLRYDLPSGWLLDANGNTGVTLKVEKAATIHEVWELYMRDSLTMQVLKALLVHKIVLLPAFLEQNGVSFDTLKRQIKQVNQKLQAFQLEIKLTNRQLSWGGEETAIRIFYHRLLLPFTHQHFFFEDYAVHEENYATFLRQLKRANLAVETENVFGICWFFINTIRIKAGCLITQLDYQRDSLFERYQEQVAALYASEGISLKNAEHFFAFFCFLESWNYELTPSVRTLLHQDYPQLFETTQHFLASLELPTSLIADTWLNEDLVLFLIKYDESSSLADQFLLEYAEVLAVSQARFASLTEKITGALTTGNFGSLQSRSAAVINTLVLLIQSALARKKVEQVSAFLIYQGEPAWKQFLIQELRDLVGPRIRLVEISPEKLSSQSVKQGDFVISNYPLEVNCQLPLVYLSSLPKSNELQELRDLIRPYYF